MKRTSLLILFALLIAGTAAVTLAVSVKHPRNIVREALANFKEAGSFSVKGTVDTVIRTELPLAGASAAATEIAMPLHIIGQGAFRFGDTGRHVGTLQLSVADETTGADLFGLELRSSDAGTTYVRFAEGEAVSKVAERWFYVDGAAVDKTDPWSGLWSGLTSGETLLYREQTASEIIDDAPVWHFILDTRPGAFDDLLAGLYGVLRVGSEDSGTDEKVRQAIAKHDVGAEIWIDKKTKEIRRFALAVVPPASETVSLPVTLVLDLYEHGRPVQVDVPDKVEPLSGAISTLFASPTE